MALDAGSVYATLGGRFNVRGFEEFDAAMKGSRARAQAFERDLKASQARSSKTLDSLGSAAKKAATYGVAGLGAALAASVFEAASFERSMRNVNSIANLTPATFERTKKAVLDMSRTTAQSPKLLADGLYQIYSSGVKGEGALKVLKASAIAATAGLSDTGTAATAVVGVLDAYRLKADQASHVSDILFQTVNRGVITFPELAHTIGTVLPFAAALKIPLNDVGAAVSTLTKEGIPAANATTYLKNAMTALTKPSDALKKAIKETGAESGQALVKSKGFQGALEALLGTTDGSQKALHALFPDIRANAAVLALTGSNAKSAEADLRAFTNTAVKGAAGKVFAEQSKSASFQLQQLKANLESSAITLGNEFLPGLNKGAQALSKFLSGAQKSGAFDQVGADIKAGFGEAVQVIGDFVHVGGEVVGTVEQVAGALGHLAGIDLGDPTQVEAIIAAYLSFQTVAVVGPKLVSLASGLQDLSLAFQALRAGQSGVAGALVGELTSGIGPIKAAGFAVAGLAAALVLLGGHEESEAKAAKSVTDAKNAEADAIRTAQDAALAAADATFGARQADLDFAKAKDAVTAASKKYGIGSKQYKDAVQAEDEAALRATEAHKHLGDAKAKENKDNTAAIDAAKKHVSALKDQISTTEKYRNSLSRFSPELRQLAVDKLTQQFKDLAKAQKTAADTSATARLAQLQYQRLLHGGDLINSKNVQQVAQLTSVFSQLPKNTQAKVSVESQGALAQIGNLIGQLGNVPDSVKVKVLTDAHGATAQIQAFMALLGGIPARKVTSVLTNTKSGQVQVAALRALIAGVPVRKITNIEANTGGARSQIAAINAAINSLHDKTVTVTTRSIVVGSPGHQHRLPGAASGRGKTPGAQAAVIGEGAGDEYRIDSRTGEGYKTRGPELAVLSPHDYVIPLEDRYRGRAVGLWAALARDLGVPGFARGRGRHKPSSKGHHHSIPPRIDPLSLDVQAFQDKQSKAAQTVQSDHSKVSSLESQIHNAERSLKTAGKQGKKSINVRIADLRKQLRTAQQREKNDRAVLAERKKELAEAKANQAKIDHYTSLANQARDAMQHADTIGDEHAFDAAKGARIADLQKVHDLLVAQRAHVKDQAFGDQLDELIGGAVNDIDDANKTDIGGSGPSELTADQQRQLDDINAAIALAALTPDLADDQTALGQKVGLYSAVLAGLQAQHAPSALIAQAASDLKSARDDLSSLTDNSPDLQAQLAQAQQQAAVATETARLANAAVAVFGGPGDIGAGGGSAYGVVAGQPRVQVNQTFQMLHPGSPGVAKAVGDAAAAGFGYQGFRPTTRAKVGR